jgi:hypothetical protein
MTVQEIVKRVRAAIDEQAQDGTNLAQETTDVQNLTSIIVDKIGYALTHVLERAPLDKLDSDAFETYNATQLEQNFSIDATTLVGLLKLPSDLLRIIEARLSSWSHFPTPESDTSQVYLMQQDEYARGSWDRPVNIRTHQGSDIVLEMYSAKTTSDTLNFVFIRKPDASNISVTNMATTNVDVPKALEAALVYQVAGLTMVAFREDIASSLFTIAERNLMGDALRRNAGNSDEE